MLWKNILLLFIVLAAYVVIGGVIFHYLEQPHETELKTDTYLAHMNFLSNFSCLGQDDLESFVFRVLEVYKKGVISTANFTSETNWDFISSFFFTSTVVTTIGYGNIAPTTLGGQIFCTFYALGGIPLCTVLMASVGQKLRYPITKLQRMVATGRTQLMEKCIKMVLVVILGHVLVILIPSLLISHLEDWHYGEALYYSVITLTTIGFGDYIAGLKPSPYRGLYRAACSVWLMLGLAWVALIIGEASGDITSKIAVKEKECKRKAEKCTKTKGITPCEEVEMTSPERDKM